MYRDYDNFDDFDEVLTLSQLSKEVDEEYECMSEEEKYCRLRDCDPTFLEYCCSFMHSNNLDKITINRFNYKCEKCQ